MKSITVPVQVQVRDDIDIDSFLVRLAGNMEHDKVKTIMRMEECPSEKFSNPPQRGDFDKLKASYNGDSVLNKALSDWLVEAENLGYYPISDSGEGDKAAIAEASLFGSEKDKDGDQNMDTHI